MDHANKILYSAFGAILFCAGVFLLIRSSEQYRETLETVRENYKEDSTVYRQYEPEASQIVSYAELIASLLYKQEFDIEVEGIKIAKGSVTGENIGEFAIRDTDYIKSYQYDNQGNITKIIYRPLFT